MTTSLAKVLTVLLMASTTLGVLGMLAYALGLQLLATVVLVFLPIAFKKRWYKWIYILYKTLPRDIRAAVRFLRLSMTFRMLESKNIHEMFKTWVDKQPDKVCFYFEDTAWTFAQVEEFSNKCARYFKQQGLKQGDTASLMLESRPEYVCIWLGLSKIGVVTAFINYNLRKQPLTHSFLVANSSAIIFGSDYIDALKDVRKELPNEMKLYQFNSMSGVENMTGAVDLKEMLKSISGDYLGKDLARIGEKDKLFYVFTSGTTGLPKAAVISSLRFKLMPYAMNCMLKFTPDDVIYNPLPLYHSSGGLVGAGQALLCGCTVVIRRKFSATNYWKDCIKYKCTVGQYIGEICRYLLAVPEGDPAEKNHQLRILFGNGLREQIWNQFCERFNIPHIGEFYGATEGNCNLVNFEDIPAVGFKPRYAGKYYPVYLIRYDTVTGNPLRNKYGFCEECDVNEPGIFVGKIDKKKAVSDFVGYTDAEATKKKILENVFQRGDYYFNSGDILVMDELGFYHFRDRTGDTFRWKGENVATSEVEAVISNMVGLQDATVYGVQVPNTEGKCGMVAIVDTNNKLNLQDLARNVRKNLPAYAYPLFVRIMEEVPVTGTFKLKKVDLQNEGYDLTKVRDKLYFYDSKSSEYVPLTKQIYQDIMDGKIRL